MSQALAAARAAVGRASRVVVLTGAGVSAESGVPTFRGAGGLWNAHRPEDLASPEAFARDPRLVWEWYAWRRGLVAACEPNAAHLALARFALARAGTLLVTQNVDGLHHRAAALEAGPGRDPSPAYPIEVHGALHRDRCSECGRRTPALARVDARERASLPRCEACAGLLRPDVVWFGEALDAEQLDTAWEASARADLCLVIGTSAVVYPVASMPDVTLEAGGAVIEVNPEVTPLTPKATWSLRGSAAALVPRILS